MENRGKFAEKLENTLECKNPKCITTVEKYAPNIFYLVDEEKGLYRCQYCDHMQPLEEK